MLLDDTAPRYEFGERHAISIRAPRDVVFESLREVRFCDSRLFTFLMLARALPIRLARRRSLSLGGFCQPVFEWAKSGFTILSERPSQEIVFGRIGQFWKPFGGLSPRIRDTHDFLTFGTPGFAKVATNFLAFDEPGGARLITETRVLGTDGASSKTFGAYWKMISWGSSLIRREWLKAIKRRSEGHR